VLVSDRRDDDEPIGIEADVPEADWIEQHQPVIDESDDDLYPRELDEDHDETVSIEADVPEADWIEQHQPVIDEPDDDLREDDEPPVATPPRPAANTSRDLPDSPAPDSPAPDSPAASKPSTGARGCNLVGALVHALLRSRTDPRSSG
jgi:hypothetical protein